jgi:rhodanese-related sulfurtransferase
MTVESFCTRVSIRICVLLFFVFQLADSSYAQNYRSGDTIHAHIDVDSAFSIIQYNKSNPAFVILDVRSVNEFNIYHLWNGVLLDYNSPSFDSMLNTLDKNKIYLIHCASGGRSNNAFNLMKSKQFKILYNVLGGIVGWNSAGYPITDSIRPVIMSVSDTFLDFDSVLIGDADTMSITITNFGNGLLTLNSISGISSSDFITDFIPGTEIFGLYDYTFQIIYKPEDHFPDSIAMTIHSNGGEQQYVLKGACKTSSIKEINKEDVVVFPNPSSGLFYIKANEIKTIDVLNSEGRLVQSKQINPGGNLLEMDISDYEKGVYVLKIDIGNQIIVRKLLIN